MSQTRKLIEVSLPLEDINRESAREKEPFTRNHPRSIHVWWARRPLATARAVLFAQLVDDPSSHPDRFPTAEAQKAERERLHGIIRRMVKWENIGDERLFNEARAEIRKSTNGNPPPILDPFCGGGTIPLEAQRLGLEAYGSDLNPVAVLITKALIEIPPKFAGRPPVFPGVAESRLGVWPRSTGLAEDVRRYGGWMRDRAEERIGHLYPRAVLDDGSDAAVIAWIWARTANCPNPSCGIEMPLVHSWWLRKKRGKEAYVVPTVVNGPSGRRVTFAIGHDPLSAPTKGSDGTVGRTAATCIACGTSAQLSYVRAQGRAGLMGARLLAIVAEGSRGRVYLPPNPEHESAVPVERPAGAPVTAIPDKAPSFRVQAYGMTRHADLFTNRQLTALTVFSELVPEVRERVYEDALSIGAFEGERLEVGGYGAAAYADAIAVLLGLTVSRGADLGNALTSWNSTNENIRALFARQAIPMVWDFVEANALGPIGALSTVEGVARLLGSVEPSLPGWASLVDASECDTKGKLISTDPPYYDNIGYSDLSDFFYVWLRRALGDIFPGLLATVLVPKSAELVANPYRHGGKEGAARFFQQGFEKVFTHARETATEGYPIAVYYAFKQQELESEGVVSTGWASMLDAMIRAGWAITATWPVRTERTDRLVARGSNALASSIVLALRPRNQTAVTTSRRGFLNALKAELPEALREMQQGAIAPVDLGQATIGPGMAIFSRYARVVEADGSAMSVRTALALINQALDEVLTENDSDLDADSRFCLRWYAQFGWKPADFGLAETMANALNTPVKRLEDGGVLTAREGLVRLIRPNDLPRTWDPIRDDRISIWEVTCHLARALSEDGVDTAARLMARAGRRVDLESVQLLAYRLYDLAQKKDPEDAVLFNALGTEWADLSAGARSAGVDVGEQPDLGLGAL